MGLNGYVVIGSAVVGLLGLKYIGVGTTALGWTMGAVLVAAGGYWLVRAGIIRPNEPGVPAPADRVPAERADDVPVR